MLLDNTRIRSHPIGQIFTPEIVAKFMVKNISDFIKTEKRDIQKVKVLEPSAGRGIFLTHLLNNSFSDISAYEMDISLKNKLLDSFPSINFKFDNFLSSKDTEKFDLIIGNPPYLGQNYNAEIFQTYTKDYPICAKYFVGNMDLFYFFIHLGIEKLNPGGFLSYITTNYWINKSQKTGIKLLKPHILDECYILQYLDLSSLNIFDGAKGQHNCIFVLQKKTEQEKLSQANKGIQIIQVIRNNSGHKINGQKNHIIFEELINNSNSKYIRKYPSALTNNDLSRSGNWNLIYPYEIKSIVDKIESYCEFERDVQAIQDYLIIRNGLILINDKIFILKEGEQLRIEDNNCYIRANGTFLKLNENEKTRLKKIYKSKSIKPFGFNSKNFVGYLLYFNKNEFSQQPPSMRSKLLEKKYPALSQYIKQFETNLRKILINAKENPDDFYYPRRGSLIRRTAENGKEELVDLEPFYENHEKIFFRFISNDNIFGYSHEPYYATSDTYFLWPLKNKKFNYLFTLAYLNSKLVSFLFKAKNINVKRSKTKLEHDIPMPNLKNFNSPKKKAIVNTIKSLAFLLVDNLKCNTLQIKIQNTLDKLFFELFDLYEIELENLLRKYYISPSN
ncbi:MAG: Eco57I restriction-modification methylase domain-containing protein [Candidatus Thorarchaeota archaeon]